MAFGLTPAGYVHKKYSDILGEMQESLASKGYSVGRYDPISVMLAIVASALSLTWEALQFAFWQGDEDKVYDTGLDILYSRLNLTRLASAPTTGLVTFNGPDQVIPSGTLLETIRGEKFSTDVDITIAIGGGAAIGPVTALVNGPTIVLTGELNRILVTLPGVTVSNASDLIIGRLKESDLEFRVRKRGYIRGAGTIPAIKSKLFNVSGVSDLRVVSNFWHLPDADGRPAQSVEAIVAGGADQDIIDVIGDNVSAGNISTSTAAGANKIIGSWIDPLYSKSYQVEFSRPTTIIAWAVVNLYTFSTIPQSEIDKIISELVKYSQTLGIGDDIRKWELHALVDIVLDTQNVKSVTSSIGAGVIPVYNTGDLEIDDTSIASLDSSRITVNQIRVI